MEIMLIATAVLYVLWLISMVVMGTTEHVISFTLMFVLLPVIVIVLAFLAPLAVIFSKTARDAALAEMKKGGK